MSFFIIYIIILIIKIISSDSEDCSKYLNCFNCTLSLNCSWKDKKCVNSPEIRNFTLFKTDNKTILFNNMKYLKNICYESKTPYIIDDNKNNVYNKMYENYCGKRKIVVTNDILLKGYKIQLNKVNNKYGYPNMLCEYIFISGSNRHDLEIYINRSLSKDFLLFYSENNNKGLVINYTKTLSLLDDFYQSAFFLYYSNKSFDTPPFIISFKEYRYVGKDILQYLFLLAIIAFVAIIVTGIIYVRKNSIFFDKNGKKYQKIDIKQTKKETDNEIKLSVINEENSIKNENKKNDLE